VLHISTPGAVSRTFEFQREPHSPAAFFGHPTSSFIQSSLHNLVALSSSVLSHLLSSNSKIWLTECIGYGIAGQVFIGTANNKTYAVKIAPWKDGKKMLQQEADIYKVLSPLQGKCIPKIYGFFTEKNLKALVMQYMGHAVTNISDLDVDQRCIVFSFSLSFMQ
jgi:hypothetical protein